MEKARYGESEIYANEIDQNLSLLEEVRRASKSKLLFCAECGQPVKYRSSSDRSVAHFAHHNNEECEYSSILGKMSSDMRIARMSLRDAFGEKIFIKKPNYSNWYYENGEQKIAIRLGTKSTKLDEIEDWNAKCQFEGYKATWAIVTTDSNPHASIRNSDIYKYLIQLTNLKSAVIISVDKNRKCQIKQCAEARERYEHADRDIYAKIASISDLTFENDEITIKNFSKEFNDYLDTQRKAYEEKQAIHDDELNSNKEDNYSKSKKWSFNPERLSGVEPTVPPKKVASVSKKSYDDFKTVQERYSEAKRRLFDKVYGERLNPEQCRAVFTARGPLLVLAGAGSGKTTVLVNRIAYLIKYGNAYFSDLVPDTVTEQTVHALEAAYGMPSDEIAEILPEFITEQAPPWSVLAITFTNKAAGEIKERLRTVFEDPDVANDVWAGTFHSICMRILRRYGDRLGYSDGFTIYDTDDKRRMVTRCMQELGVDEKRLAVKAVCNAISMAKDELVSPEDYDVSRDSRGREISAVYRLYQQRMMANNAVDFDDIIMKTVELLDTDAEVREHYQRKFRYVLVDEYQDTNYAQFVLTKILSDGYRNIMVVGDDDQSIYRFRGATIENILNFDKTYPDATVVKLEQNYRSTGNILAAANAVIRHNGNRHDKSLWCDKGDGEPIRLREALDQNDEGKYIIDRIVSGVYTEKRKYSDYAVLYRVNALGRSLQTTFAKSGVPYRVIGDMGFYDRKEIKDMVAYLSLTSSERDNLRLKRIINEPKRKIGTATVETLEEIANMNGIPMYEVMRRIGEYPVLAKSAERLTSFVRLIEEVKAEKTLPSEILAALYERSGYEAMLRAEGFEGEGKMENVRELIGAAVEYETRLDGTDTEPTVQGFLEEISLITDVDKYDEDADAVVLMTIHAAKGLEFPVVFIAGMEDGIFPSQQNFGEVDEMSEERRLAYVAITRAKDRLYITHTQNRMMYGKTAYNPVSRFVREIPSRYIEEDKPRKAPPRASYEPQRPTRSADTARIMTELRRRPEIVREQPKRPSGAAGYGIERLPEGTRVAHGIFGDGAVVSARDMGGDILYEVRFDNGQTKKLMATFAKLRRI